ncbi:lipoprotein [Ferrigenium kumadai]|uniref:Lipoprotein n=1 Tax=Ferrigenium kumadai TaxID=1682490 RepID=A0AAN1T1L3_9PROT|nr:hypothetical protein [Ferrigenium kumadai]BBJ00336.1 lipoprotein [Ferrigenium kumadai]
MDIRQSTGGILIRGESAPDMAETGRKFFEQAAAHGIDQYMEATDAGEQGVRFRLRPDLRHQWAPGCDTRQLCERLGLDSLSNPSDLEKEILLAMLLGPVTFEYPSHDELVASIRVRRNVAEAARRTALAFHTSKIERPTDYWTYTEERGFTILPGKPLIEALRKATQPEVSGQQYSFSCYRATEYVMLLGIAQELATCNPVLLQQLQRQWESRAIMSRQYHDVFLREYGSMDEPLPPGYYVPGERLWFRNPDERSADVSGYEGSWVIYMGGGLFTNFWNCDKPYTLASKCIEIYHWRDGVYQDAEGNSQMDEAIVEERVRATLSTPGEVERILNRMMRMRDPQDVYADGGCIDASREYARWICPSTADLILPQE